MPQLNVPKKMKGSDARKKAWIDNRMAIARAGKTPEAKAKKAAREDIRQLFRAADYRPKNGEINRFYKSSAWLRSDARLSAIENGEGKCLRCGSRERLVVDHIKSVRLHWGLRFDASNLQLLCNQCNRKKGSVDSTDYR